MKKIVFLMFALAMVANEAFAFNTFAHQTISKLTEMNLNEKTKQEVKAILKTSITKECVWLNTLRKNPEMAHTKSWHFFQLDANGKSTTMDENDGIVQLEKAIAVLRNRKSHSAAEVQTALRTVIHLVQDLHCLSHIRIEGIEATKGFTFRIWNELDGKGRKEWNQKWYTMWESTFSNRYTIFTPQYYAEDIDIYAREKKAEYSKGEPRFWVENGGEDVVRALKLLNTGAVVPTQVVLTHEFNHTKCMAKAAYRLAALLNDIFK